MVNNTTNIGLLKPTEDELYSIDIANQNMDLIDTEFKNQSDKIDLIEVEINTPDSTTIALDKTTKVLTVADSYASPSDLKIGGASLYNAVTNGDFSGGTTGWSAIGGSIAVVNGKLEFTENTSNSEHYIQCSVSGIKASTKHFIEATCLNGGVVALYNLNSVGGYDVYEGTTIIGSGISKLVFTTGTINVSPTAFIRLYPKFIVYTGTGAKYSFDDLMLIPITGTPYEAFTADQMNGLVNKYIDKLQGAKAVVVGSRGRNLFDGESESGVYNLTTGLFYPNSDYVKTKKFITVKKNQTYTLKEVVGTHTDLTVVHFNNGNIIGYTTHGAGGTFTTMGNQIGFYINNINNQGMMLNEGTTALPYEPYQGSLATVSATRHKLPNLVEDEDEDELKFVDGKWVFVKRTAEYVLTSADITIVGDYTSTQYVGVPFGKLIGLKDSGVTDMVGTKAMTSVTRPANSASITANAGLHIFDTTFFLMTFPLATYANLAAAQAALAGTKVVYQLATPLIIEEQDFAQYGITVDGSLSSNLDYTEYFVADHDIMADVSIDYSTNLAKAVEQLKDSTDSLREQMGVGSTIKSTTAPITLYVRTDGNDANDGSANIAEGAIKTIQSAIDRLPKYLKHNVTINVAAGTYAEDVVVKGFVGDGEFKINGGTSNADAVNYIIKSFSAIGSSACIRCYNLLSNTTTQNAFSATTCAKVVFNGVVSTVASSYVGVFAHFSAVHVGGSIISNKATALAAHYSTIATDSNAGTGNAQGLYAAYSGFISKAGPQPIGTTQELAQYGGVITGEELTTTITTGFAAGWSGSILIRKSFDNLVEINVNLTKSTDVNTEVVFTLPVGLRPIYSFEEFISLVNQSNVIVVGNETRFVIGSDGVISVISAGTTTNGRTISQIKAMYYSS